MVRLDDFAYGVRRFVVGLAKKTLVANIVAVPADRIFAMPAAQFDAGHAWLGIAYYTLQIYFDFSGYSDMAIGLGRMFGFRFPENFRYPYIARTVQEFWRRWHISLSTWFRDYLFRPLGVYRVSLARMYGNLMIVFLLCGLWHGASWNFAVWGLFHADDGGIEDYLQTEPFTIGQLEAWRLTRERTRDWLKARGIPYLFVITPDKQMIDPEYMPHSLRRMRAEYRADQLIAHMRARSDLDVLDLRPAIVEAKSAGLLYHLYDTHWNDRGALAGYQQIAGRLRRWFPAVRPLTRADFDESPAVPSGDKTTMLGLVDRGKATMPGLVLRRGWTARVVEPAKPDPYGEEGRLVTEIPGSPFPRAVMFRDSFAGRLIPCLSEHFSRIVYLWQNDFDTDVVQQERPDVVIQEVVGRHLLTHAPYPDGIPH